MQIFTKSLFSAARLVTTTATATATATTTTYLSFCLTKLSQLSQAKWGPQMPPMKPLILLQLAERCMGWAVHGLGRAQTLIKENGLRWV